MHSSTFSFERVIPALPWRGLAFTAALLTLGATVAWEIRCRTWGYGPTLNDMPDLWAQRREAVKPDSLVIIGDSRPLFDLDLDQLEQGLGQRPVQLALAGSCAYPVLADLAADEKFHGTIICSIVPGMWMAPRGFLLETSQTALKRYHTWTWAQRAGHELGMLTEEHIAFLKQDDLTLAAWLGKIPLPVRPGTAHPPFPPYFATVDRERRARMTEQCAQPGALQDQIKYGWPALFTPPPPPSFVPPDAFAKFMGEAIEARFRDTAAAVKKFRARGGKIVFVRFPHTEKLKELEDAGTPRAGIWTRILNDTGAPGIYYSDYPEIANFKCPEWSHLSGPDSVEFSKRLAPLLKEALAGRLPPVPPPATPPVTPPAAPPKP